MIKRIKRTNIYQSKWIRLHTDKVQLPSGRIIEKYHILDYPNEAVVILVENEHKQICFIRALRYSSGSVEWELPAGGIEPDESPEQAARREFKEETGFNSESEELIYSYNPSNGMSNQVINVVFARFVEGPQCTFDTDEVLSVHWLGQEEIKRMLQQKQIRDGLALTALLMHQLHQS